MYDVVFKYLLEDIEIARELLSSILGEEITALELKPQEMAVENPIGTIGLLRFDFKAKIKTKDGDEKKVLIELQKTKKTFNIMRFRRYLGENYRKEEETLNSKGKSEKHPFPIITIYILGFRLPKLRSAVVKIDRQYRDMLTEEILAIKEKFAELLTHGSYIIQVRRLEHKSRTKLERILQVFNPEFETDNSQKLEIDDNADEPIVKKMISRLGRAIASEEIREIMDVEDEIERAFARELRKVNKKLYRRSKMIVQKKRELIAEKQRTEAEKEKAEAEKQRAEAKEQELAAERQKADAEKQRAEAKEQELTAERQRTEALLKELEELKKQMKK